MSVLFSPKGGVASKLISLISAARGSVDAAVYSFTNADVSKALITKANSGVIVRVILDKMQTNGSQAKIHDALEKGGVQVRLYRPKGGIMHNKFLVTDGHLAETGSYNYTNNAENVNCENAVFPVTAGLVDVGYQTKLDAAFQKTFNQMWALAQTEPKSLRSIRRFLRKMTQPPDFL